MKIINAVCSKGLTGFFFDDQHAIKNGALKDGSSYLGIPHTDGFSSVRQPGESISIMLMLEDGMIAYGDCAAVQYSGAGGRDPLFLADIYMEVIKKTVFPLLIGQDVTNFREMAQKVDHMINPLTGKKLHTAVMYGVTQALLHAVAISQRKLMTEVIADEYGLEAASHEIPVFSQSGDLIYENADKMIIKKADSLPHGLFNNIPDKLGYQGEKLIEYVSWLEKRIRKLGSSEYTPTIHIDVYGTVGIIFNHQYDKMTDYFMKLKKAAGNLAFRLEGPVDMNERNAQVETLSVLTSMVNIRISGFEIVADEWCNTLEDIKYFADCKAGHMLQIKTPDLGGINNTAEAVLYCKKKNIGAYQGGTCNETEWSAKVCVHIAMATSPDLILAKPGMGVDEGFMIVHNEMQRILALRRRFL
ncbi:MAG: methylaspartate ammonia-lyase [Clostridia bacterium]|nr:methylaspartate ammonia-lyase [Clostridia bacterium]